MPANRFDQLNEAVNELTELLDDPGDAEAAPFLTDVVNKARDVLAAAEALTLEDFDAEYEETEDDNNDEEETI